MRTEYVVEVYNKYHDSFVEQIDVFETYEEDGILYCTLRNAKMM